MHYREACGNKDFSLEIKEAAKYLEYGFGGGVHESSGNYTVDLICARYLPMVL